MPAMRKIFRAQFCTIVAPHMNSPSFVRTFEMEIRTMTSTVHEMHAPRTYRGAVRAHQCSGRISLMLSLQKRMPMHFSHTHANCLSRSLSLSLSLALSVFLYSLFVSRLATHRRSGCMCVCACASQCQERKQLQRCAGIVGRMCLFVARFGCTNATTAPKTSRFI